MTTDIHLTGPLEQTRGVIGRYPQPDERYVFEFDTVRPRFVHMVGVTQPLHVEWHARDELVAEQDLRPWTGWAIHRADRIVEAQP